MATDEAASTPNLSSTSAALGDGSGQRICTVLAGKELEHWARTHEGPVVVCGRAGSGWTMLTELIGTAARPATSIVDAARTATTISGVTLAAMRQSVPEKAAETLSALGRADLVDILGLLPHLQTGQAVIVEPC